MILLAAVLFGGCALGLGPPAVAVVRLRQYAQKKRRGPQEAESMKKTVAALGGPDVAAGRVRLYLSLPNWAAPEKLEVIRLLELCGSRGIDALCTALSRSDQEIGRYAAYSLGTAAPVAARVDKETAAIALARYLDGPDEKRSWAALNSLEKMGPGAIAAVPGILRVLKNGSVAGRERAATAVYHIRPRDERVVAALIPVIAAAKDANPISTFTQALLRIGPGIGSAIAGELDRRTPQEREVLITRILEGAFVAYADDAPTVWATVIAAGLPHDKEEIERAVRRLDASNLVDAAKCLGALGDPRAEAILTAFLVSSKTDEAVRDAAREALEKIKKAQEEKKENLESPPPAE